MIHIAYAPELVEECVLLAERTMTAADRRAFRRERDPLYQPSEEREARFRALHERWFERLCLRQPIESCLQERPNVVLRLSEARVLPAVSAREEGADLIDRLAGTADAVPLLAIRLRPSALLDPESLRLLLRRELLHVDDMLDSGFGYQRTLPASELGALGDTLIQARYRVAWDVTIDGRLSRTGVADYAATAAHRQEFAAAFSMLGPRADLAFDRWFALDRPTHAALAVFAHNPTLESHEALS